MADEHLTPEKACTKCAATLPATTEFFRKHSLGKYGLNPRCRECCKADEAERRARPDQAERQQAWRDANKEKVREYNLAYRAAGYKSTAHVVAWRRANVEQSRKLDREKARRHRERHPERIRARSRSYYERNRGQIIAKRLDLYRSDLVLNLRHKMRTQIRKLIRRGSGRRTESLLGYSVVDLAAHIKRQFTKGMTWAKVLSGEIHIDHIVPVRAFDIREPGDAEFRACWALSNLRPLWARDNLRKSGKVLTLL